jgi:hypothetical protein
MLRDEINVFKGVTKSYYFIGIMIFVAGMQIVLGELGGRPMNVSVHVISEKNYDIKGNELGTMGNNNRFECDDIVMEHFSQSD